MSFSLLHRLYTLRVSSVRLLRLPSQLTMSSVTSTDNVEFKKRSVVSNFIFNLDTPDGKPKVALFRRSGQVSTYQHHLAPISGSIEKDDASPLAAAWREIEEETTLTSSSLALLRQGKSYTFSDPSIRREWTIYPFAWRLKTSGPGEQDVSNKINIDWEHESWGWYDPLAVQDSEAFGGVPRLNESLRRVWFEKDLGEEAGRVLADGLDKLANDFTSGARQMAGVALGILMVVIKTLPSSSSSEESPEQQWWTNVRFAAWHIWKNGRESMGAAIMSALLTALSEIERTVVSNPAEFESRTRRSVDILTKQMEARNESASLVAQSLMAFVESTFPPPNDTQEAPRMLSILTLSESSTIYQALNSLITSPSPSLQGLLLDICILESRPLFEGVSLASKLIQSVKGCQSDQTRKRNSHKITLCTDASAALASQNVHLVLIGADRVSSDGSVSNKTGTLPAVLSARYVTSVTGQPAKVVVLAESDKIAPSRPGSCNGRGKEKHEDHVVESGNPSYVTRTWESTASSSDRIRAAAGNIMSIVSTSSATARNVDEHMRDIGASVSVQVQNVTFEWCPPDLIDVYITEKGEWTVEDIAQHSAKLGIEEARIFGPL